MPSKITKLIEIDPKLITVAPPKRNRNNGLTASVLYDNKPFPNVQLPKMPLPFGIGSFTDKDSGIKKYSLNLSFRYKETNPETSAAYDVLKAIDAAVVAQMADRSKEWFQKQYSSQFIGELFKCAITPAKNPQYADTLKVKLNDREAPPSDGKIMHSSHIGTWG
jgi:hypothetical protein